MPRAGPDRAVELWAALAPLRRALRPELGRAPGALRLGAPERRGSRAVGARFPRREGRAGGRCRLERLIPWFPLQSCLGPRARRRVAGRMGREKLSVSPHFPTQTQPGTLASRRSPPPRLSYLAPASSKCLTTLFMAGPPAYLMENVDCCATVCQNG